MSSYQQSSSGTSEYVSRKTLPHLPRGIRVPKLVATDNKPLPPGEWQEQQTNQDSQQMQMVPGQQGGGGSGRRELQPFHAGASRTDQGTRDKEPPPIFASEPKRSLTLKRPSKVQQQIYRMSGGIEPVDLLCNRLYVWRSAIKDLNEMFKNIIDVEVKASGGYAASNKPLEVPFRESSNQFLQSGGVQDVWVAYRNYTVEKSMMHHEYAGYLKSAVTPSLANIENDIKMFIKSIEKDPALRSSILYNSRREADYMVNQLDTAVKYVHHTPDKVLPGEDPALLNLGKSAFEIAHYLILARVIQAFRSLYNEENKLHENVIQLQREAATVEQRIFGSLANITSNWEHYLLDHRIDARSIVGKVKSTIANIEPNSDWNEFVRRNQFQLVNEKATYKTDDEMQYANQNNSLCIPSKVNFLNRKTALKKWKEGLYVLTPCGYLHGFKNAKHFETDPLSPELSIFLPQASVSSTDELAEDLCFQVSGRKKTLGGQKSFVFQAIDESDLAEWYSEAQRLSQVNETHDALDIEAMPAALPGMEPHERDNGSNRLLTNGDQGSRMIEDNPHEASGSEDEEHLDEEHLDEDNNNNLSTAAVLPDNMSPSTPRLQKQQQPGKSPLSKQVSTESPQSPVTPVAAAETPKDTFVTANSAGTPTAGTPSGLAQQQPAESVPGQYNEDDFIERYNDKLHMDDATPGATADQDLYVGSAQKLD